MCLFFRYLLKHLSRCVTAKECELEHNRWVFNNTCISECPSKYEKVGDTCQSCTKCHKICNSTQVTNIDDIKKMEGCTNITGSLQIRLDAEIKGNIDEELEKYLGHIEEIGEYLKVYRSVQIRNFKFLKNLRVIKGNRLEQNRYALFVFENPQLLELWGPEKNDIEVQNGTFSFHFNPKLCPSEIDRLAKVSKLKMNYTWMDVSNHSNGDSFACNNVNINVNIVNITETFAVIQWTAPEVNEDEESSTQYLIFYKEVDDYDPEENEEEEECGVPTWVTAFVFFNDNQTVFTYNISDLRTYTNYSYFVRTNSRLGGRSEIQYFLTMSGDPSVPMNVHADPLSDNSSAIRLSWEPPTNINGILSHYIVVGYLQSDEQSFIDGRNYCRLKMVHQSSATEMPLLETTTTTELPINNYCECAKKDNSTITVIQEKDFDAICSDLDKFTYNVSRGVNSHGCASYKYQVIPAHKKYTQDEKTIEKREETTTILPEDQKVKEFFSDGVYQVFEKTVEPGEKSVILNSLKHYTIYILLLAACNENRTENPQCSSVVMVSQRTGRKSDADDIPNLHINLINLYDIEIMWEEPTNPNGVIVSYDIIYKNLNKEKSTNMTECITRKEHESSNYKYVLKNLPPGEYILNVRANSLAGPGNFSPTKTFKIIIPSRISPIVIVVIAFIIFIILSAVAFIYWYYKIRPFANMQQLIANVNPEYAEFRDGDRWNIRPENLEVKEELGKGTFGKVFNGVVNTLEEGHIPCAIKTLNDGATMHDQMEFVNEAAVMKSFSDAHHVIKLIGVCTRGTLMVVMELMERGDLKTYLRNNRESSASLGFAEICRMATEIADGMSYLSAKKYVHRDLAARNCMVSRDRTVKIGDFGMTRDIYETDYYRKETRGLLPVRWMSPESLADGVFTSDSDAWSYGVVLWEIVTYAEQPYQGMSNEQVLQFVTSGGTLSRPKECPDLIWSIMSQCFSWVPNRRPLFMEIVERLDEHVGADFRLVSFYYSRAGQDFRRTTAEINVARQEHQPAMMQGRVAAHWSRDDEDAVHFEGDSPSGSPTTMSLLNHPQSLPRSLPNEYSPCPGTSGLQNMK